ncbi:MAG: hypothetical protein VCA57_08260 [Pseudomonas sp.]
MTLIARLTLLKVASAQTVVSDVECLPVCRIYLDVECAQGLTGCKALAGN